MDLDSVFQYILVFPDSECTGYAGDHFKITASLLITISNPNLNWMYICSMRQFYQKKTTKSSTLGPFSNFIS